MPIGEIPNELKVSPFYKSSQLNNGATVHTEVHKGKQTTVSIFLRAGSRYETLQSSGAARLLTNLFLRGTKNNSRSQLEEKIANLGGRLSVTLEREILGLTIDVLPSDVREAVNLLCEMVLEVNLEKNQLENEK